MYQGPSRIIYLHLLSPDFPYQANAYDEVVVAFITESVPCEDPHSRHPGLSKLRFPCRTLGVLSFDEVIDLLRHGLVVGQGHLVQLVVGFFELVPPQAVVLDG